MRRKKKIVKVTEKQKQKFREKHICLRCHTPFDSEELLQSHREYQHSEFQVNDSLREKKDLGKFYRVPPKNEWVIPLSEEKSWWFNPWRQQYFMCILGVGCITNELYPDKEDKDRLKEMVLCDESTPYFREWRDILFEGKKVKGEPTPRPTLKPLRWNTPESIEGVTLPRGYTYCKNCYHIIRIILGNHYRCKKCNHLVTINEKDNSERYWDSEKQKEYTHRCKTSLEESTDDVLLLCPCCGRNIFRKSKDTNIPQSTGIIQTVKLYVKEQKRRF